jgi:hypothetical protein
MWQEILKAIPIYFSTMFKFIIGPVAGYQAGLTLMTTILLNVASMMTVVIAFAFFGDFLRKNVINRLFKRKKLFTVRNRRIVTIWKKYGIVGVAALTPCLLTPIGGSIVAISFGAPKNKMILYMFISASIWSIIFSVSMYTLGDKILAYLMQ